MQCGKSSNTNHPCIHATNCHHFKAIVDADDEEGPIAQLLVQILPSGKLRLSGADGDVGKILKFFS